MYICTYNKLYDYLYVCICRCIERLYLYFFSLNSSLRSVWLLWNTCRNWFKLCKWVRCHKFVIFGQICPSISYVDYFSVKASWERLYMSFFSLNSSLRCVWYFKIHLQANWSCASAQDVINWSYSTNFVQVFHISITFQ